MATLTPLPPELLPYADAALLTPAQCAVLWGVTRPTAYQYIKRHNLRTVRLGGHLRVPYTVALALAQGTPPPAERAQPGRSQRVTDRV